MVIQKFNNQNTSGKGGGAVVPESVASKFNRGVFFFPVLWGIWYKKWGVAFLAFVLFGISLAIPVISSYSVISELVNNIATNATDLAVLTLKITDSVLKIFSLIIFELIILNLIMLFFAFIFGKKGNSWAWQNKKYATEEAFQTTQKRWAAIGAVLKGIPLVLFIIFICLSFIIVPKIIDNYKQKAFSSLFYSAYSQLQNITVYASVSEDKAVNNFLSDEEKLALYFFEPHFDTIAAGHKGFVTKENYMYAFKIINPNCGNMPKTFDKSNTGAACAQAYIDINGKDGRPNKNSNVGNINDRFVVYVFKDGVTAPNDTIEYDLLKNASLLPEVRQTSAYDDENGGSSVESFYKTKFVTAFEKIDNAIYGVVKDSNKDISQLIQNKPLLMVAFSKYLSIREVRSDGFVDQNGVLYKFVFNSAKCPDSPASEDMSDACFVVYMDVNGDLEPNTNSELGKISDTFKAYAYAKGVYAVPKSIEAKLLDK